jgi:hypothetical protein
LHAAQTAAAAWKQCGIGTAERQRDIRAAIDGAYDRASRGGIGSDDDRANVVSGKYVEIVDQRNAALTRGRLVDAEDEGPAGKRARCPVPPLIKISAP